MQCTRGLHLDCLWVFRSRAETTLPYLIRMVNVSALLLYEKLHMLQLANLRSEE